MPVLIIEDDAVVSHLIATLLRRHGLQSVQIFRGDTAFQTIDTSGDSFEAIILDLLLPVVSGFEILERIHTTNPELLRRVIVVTAASDPRVQKIRATARSFIRKPFDLDAVVSAVRQCVNESGPADPGTAARVMR
jgi:DNA-binding response OmpR family regulator